MPGGAALTGPTGTDAVGRISVSAIRHFS
ncbi:hypothetical protein SA73_4121 [Salmonella enterica subsp. enterica serovar Agona str. 73.H.09]|nr:hypothetical protein SA73_4121 [Salmonella enterica subsp. enterica serovar Agona str. 73.H.09]